MNAPLTMSQIQQQGGAVAPQSQQAAIAPIRAGFFDLQGFELLQRVAKAFASSSLVPAQYQDNVANCMIALNLARRLGADELMVMQNLYIVHGNPGWSSKFLIASVNTCGRYNAMRYEWKGEPGTDDYGCRAWTTERQTGERLEGIWVDWKMVKAEGWSSRNGSKWKTMPDQMFIYRAAAFWTRAYAPEISMGLQTAEELADIVEVGRDGAIQVTTEALRAGIKQIDPETGEVTDAAGSDTQSSASNPKAGREPPANGAKQEPPAFNALAFSERLDACTDVDTLDLMADEIRSIQDDDLAKQLTYIYHQRRKTLTSTGTDAVQGGAANTAGTSRRGRTSARSAGGIE